MNELSKKEFDCEKEIVRLKQEENSLEVANSNLLKDTQEMS